MDIKFIIQATWYCRFLTAGSYYILASSLHVTKCFCLRLQLTYKNQQDCRIHFFAMQHDITKLYNNHPV